jgi:hypothetical protein
MRAKGRATTRRARCKSERSRRGLLPSNSWEEASWEPAKLRELCSINPSCGRSSGRFRSRRPRSRSLAHRPPWLRRWSRAPSRRWTRRIAQVAALGKMGPQVLPDHLLGPHRVHLHERPGRGRRNGRRGELKVLPVSDCGSTPWRKSRPAACSRPRARAPVVSRRGPSWAPQRRATPRNTRPSTQSPFRRSYPISRCPLSVAVTLSGPRDTSTRRTSVDASST